MDNYIKMCKESEEIQKLWVPKTYDTFYLDGEIFHERNELLPYPKMYSDILKEKAIWIPTEEQLQGIAMELPSLQGRVMQPFWELVDQFNYFLWGDETRKYVSQFKSFKEFWFAFVMKEKFKEVWDGKTWIKGT